MLRTDEQWRDYCEKHITAGYTPGGNARLTYDTGLTMARFLYERDIVRDGMNVLDVGCGNGRLAMGLFRLGIDIYYLGLDVILPSIEFCNAAFNDHAHYRFEHLDVYNEHYWPQGLNLSHRVIYPADDNSFDLVVAFSLFSHTANIATAERHLSEMHRVLSDGGSLFSTWSFTTLRASRKESAAHTVYHINDVLFMLGTFDSYEFITLEAFNKINPDQIGLWMKKGT